MEPLSVHRIGREHVACQRCKSHKIKCSGDRPTCRNCIIAKKPDKCIYPIRDSKVVILESQLKKIQNRVKYLETKYIELAQKYKEDVGHSPPALNSTDEEMILLVKKYSSSQKGQQTSENEDKTDSLNNVNINLENNIDTNLDKKTNGKEEKLIEKLSNPLSSQSEVSTDEGFYFGNSSCQVFDSALQNLIVDEVKVVGGSVKKESVMSGPHSRNYIKDMVFYTPYSGFFVLPDRNYADRLFGVVTEFLAREFYLFDVPEIKVKIDNIYENLHETNPIWICYFLVTLAVGEQYLNRTSSNSGVPGMHFFIPAMQMFQRTCEEPTIEYIQTLLIIAFYSQGLNRINSSYVYFGQAVRSALVMGLHRKVSDPCISKEEKEKRRRLWWTVFVMDSIWSAKLGQPMHVDIADTDLDLLDVDALDLHDNFNCVMLSNNVKLAIIIRKTMLLYRPTTNRTGVDSGLTPSVKQQPFVTSVLDCLSELKSLYKSLPKEMLMETFKNREDRIFANFLLRFNQIVIITSRPLLLLLFKKKMAETSRTQKAKQECIIAAKRNIEIMTSLQESGWISTYGFWDSQYIFSALLMLVMDSISGHEEYPHIEVGCKLCSFMALSGNFPAQESLLRLKELYKLLRKVSMARADNLPSKEVNSHNQNINKSNDNNFFYNIADSINNLEQFTIGKTKENNVDYVDPIAKDNLYNPLDFESSYIQQDMQLDENTSLDAINNQLLQQLQGSSSSLNKKSNQSIGLQQPDSQYQNYVQENSQTLPIPFSNGLANGLMNDVNFFEATSPLLMSHIATLRGGTNDKKNNGEGYIASQNNVNIGNGINNDQFISAIGGNETFQRMPQSANILNPVMPTESYHNIMASDDNTNDGDLLSSHESNANGLSPDTWNNLANNFQFWDSSNGPF